MLLWKEPITTPLKAVYQERFLIDMTPHGAEDEITERVGRDGGLIYPIQRYPRVQNAPRTESLAAVEPTVFSRQATHALVSVMMAFAETKDLNCLTSGKDVFILGNLRRYPEENNTFAVKPRSVVWILRQCVMGAMSALRKEWSQFKGLIVVLNGGPINRS